MASISAEPQSPPPLDCISEPVSFRVKVTRPFWSGSLNYANFEGKWNLVVTPTEFSLQDFTATKPYHSVPWHELRSLDARKLTKGSFRVDLLSGVDSEVVVVRILKGDPAVLADIFKELGEDITLPKCSLCGGPVKDGVCKYCASGAGTYTRIGAAFGSVFAFISCIILAGFMNRSGAHQALNRSWNLLMKSIRGK